MFCPNCGFKNSDGNAFCAECGGALPKEQNIPTEKNKVITASAPADSFIAAPLPRKPLNKATIAILSKVLSVIMIVMVFFSFFLPHIDFRVRKEIDLEITPYRAAELIANNISEDRKLFKYDLEDWYDESSLSDRSYYRMSFYYGKDPVTISIPEFLWGEIGFKMSLIMMSLMSVVAFIYVIAKELGNLISKSGTQMIKAYPITLTVLFLIYLFFYTNAAKYLSIGSLTISTKAGFTLMLLTVILVIVQAVIRNEILSPDNVGSTLPAYSKSSVNGRMTVTTVSSDTLSIRDFKRDPIKVSALVFSKILSLVMIALVVSSIFLPHLTLRNKRDGRMDISPIGTARTIQGESHNSFNERKRNVFFTYAEDNGWVIGNMPFRGSDILNNNIDSSMAIKSESKKDWAEKSAMVMLVWQVIVVTFVSLHVFTIELVCITSRKLRRVSIGYPIIACLICVIYSILLWNAMSSLSVKYYGGIKLTGSCGSGFIMLCVVSALAIVQTLLRNKVIAPKNKIVLPEEDY